MARSTPTADLLERGLGSESAAWALLAILSALQVGFNFMPPALGWTAVLYAALAACLCVLAIGVAVTTIASLPRRVVAIGGAVLLLALSLSHLVGAKPSAAVDIAEPVGLPSPPVTEAMPAQGGEEEASDDTGRPADVLPRNKPARAPNVQSEARIDLLGGIYRLSWRVIRDGRSQRCGPIFLRGTRALAEETLKTHVDASVERTRLGDLTCA